ncbi:cytochrome c4 [Telluria mixta]|uniref:Cytochrome c4 n=1 Tax=Telluria mixta TaxID=34071 RepID=A0ABT2BXM3_9BURK|nr:cytochrome c4 [Telluria mixta]MCS0629890.1 cytochrome c4 [Telluria mixta]WEM96556.1 cytochrome c4 [Telluria mixta]
MKNLKNACAVLALVLPLAAWAGNVEAGRIKSESERCQECHGADGNGNGEDGKFARLAGQYPAYIVKQLQDFRSGARKHDYMMVMARSLDEADIADIAAYYGGLPAMRGEATHADAATAQRLFATCAACHGPQGKGTGNAAFPVIGGQDVKYLRNQLLAWRSGERRNSPGGTMNEATKGLTDAEIDVLAHYLSGIQER